MRISFIFLILLASCGVLKKTTFKNDFEPVLDSKDGIIFSNSLSNPTFIGVKNNKLSIRIDFTLKNTLSNEILVNLDSSVLKFDEHTEPLLCRTKKIQKVDNEKISSGSSAYFFCFAEVVANDINKLKLRDYIVEAHFWINNKTNFVQKFRTYAGQFR